MDTQALSVKHIKDKKFTLLLGDKILNNPIIKIWDHINSKPKMYNVYITNFEFYNDNDYININQFILNFKCPNLNPYDIDILYTILHSTPYITNLELHTSEYVGCNQRYILDTRLNSINLNHITTLSLCLDHHAWNYDTICIGG